MKIKKTKAKMKTSVYQKKFYYLCFINRYWRTLRDKLDYIMLRPFQLT